MATGTQAPAVAAPVDVSKAPVGASELRGLSDKERRERLRSLRLSGLDALATALYSEVEASSRALSVTSAGWGLALISLERGDDAGWRLWMVRTLAEMDPPVDAGYVLQRSGGHDPRLAFLTSERAVAPAGFKDDGTGDGVRSWRRILDAGLKSARPAETANRPLFDALARVQETGTPTERLAATTWLHALLWRDGQSYRVPGDVQAAIASMPPAVADVERLRSGWLDGLNGVQAAECRAWEAWWLSQGCRGGDGRLAWSLASQAGKITPVDGPDDARIRTVIAWITDHE